METWLVDEVPDKEHRTDCLKDPGIRRRRDLRIERPAGEQIRRLIGSAVQCEDRVEIKMKGFEQPVTALLRYQTQGTDWDCEICTFRLQERRLVGQAALDAVKHDQCQAESRHGSDRDLDRSFHLGKALTVTNRKNDYYGKKRDLPLSS